MMSEKFTPILVSKPAVRRILFIHISTFGYELKIRDMIEGVGNQVITHSDRPYNSATYKGILRLFPVLGRAISNQHHLQWLHSLDRQSFHAVVVLKGESLSPHFLRLLRKKFPTIPFILYLWDSIRNVPSAKFNLAFFDHVFSFDRLDCDSLNLNYRPLFFTPDYYNNCPKLGNGIFFLGTLNGDRPKVIHKVSLAAAKASESLDYWLFQRSIGEFRIRWLFDSSLRRLDQSRIIPTPLSAQEIARRYASANAILDIQHPSQTGLTMRTFEVLASGKKLITTNASITDEPFFDPQRILVIDRKNPYIPKSFVNAVIPAMSDDFLNRYDLRSWVNDLLAPVLTGVSN